MSNILCVTNRKLCQEDFLVRIEKICKAKTDGIILREKDLSEDEYYNLAKSVLTICNKYNTTCILHNFPSVAKKLDCKSIHLPLHILKTLSDDERNYFTVLGASCHSIDDALNAQNLGCTYIFAGHIFETDCKKGLKGRGLDFLADVCRCVSMPVYAIGGISNDNYKSVISAGAYGGTIMSSIMKCVSPKDFIESFEE